MCVIYRERCDGTVFGFAPTFDVWTGVLEVAMSLCNYFVTYTMCHGSRQSKRKRARRQTTLFYDRVHQNHVFIQCIFVQQHIYGWMDACCYGCSIYSFTHYKWPYTTVPPQYCYDWGHPYSHRVSHHGTFHSIAIRSYCCYCCCCCCCYWMIVLHPTHIDFGKMPWRPDSKNQNQLLVIYMVRNRKITDSDGPH